jgi:hypothetical protein
VISVADIRKQARNTWDSGDVLRAAILGAPSFPMRLRFRKTGGRHTIQSYSEVQRWVAELNNASKTTVGYGYTVEFSEMNHRQLGRQSLPCDIRFDTPLDVASFIGEKKQFEKFLALYEATTRRDADAAKWMASNPMKVLSRHDVWGNLLDICEYLRKNPKPLIYLRQIPLYGMDTKFFEAHRAVLAELLTACLPENAYDSRITGLAKSGFERKFGFLYDVPIVRLRLLDDTIWPNLPHRDVSVPSDRFAAMDIPDCQTVFITENKVNGLSFPLFERGVVIFGLGYGIGHLAETRWLRDKRVVYWGDIDTHGYGILSMLRAKLPHVESILMSSHDLDMCRFFAVVEPAETKRTDELANLSSDELTAYKRLLPGGDSEGTRIEQERIPFTMLETTLAHYR